MFHLNGVWILKMLMFMMYW